MSGSLAVPSLSSPEHLDFSAAVLFHGSLTFFRPPLTRAGGPLLAHLRLLALPLGLLGPGAVSPVSPSPSPGPFSPGGASVIRARSGRVSTAPRHFRPSETLGTGRGASRRRPTSVAASGSSLPAVLARRAPTGGGPPGRSLDSTSYPLGRELSSWATLWPSRFLCPCKPLALPGQPRWGSWLVRRCFQALLFPVSLRLPVFPRVPFLACNLAFLACTVQIQVVCIYSYSKRSLSLLRRYLVLVSVRFFRSVRYFPGRLRPASELSAVAGSLLPASSNRPSAEASGRPAQVT